MELRSNDQPSEAFEEAVSTGGGIVATCEHCKRVHFEDDERAGDFEEGELERLRAEAKADPDKTIANGGVRTGEIDGCTVVIGCPCNALRKYEDWIWNHRRLIATYLPKRAKDEKAVADLAYALMEDLEKLPF